MIPGSFNAGNMIRKGCNGKQPGRHLRRIPEYCRDASLAPASPITTFGSDRWNDVLKRATELSRRAGIEHVRVDLMVVVDKEDPAAPDLAFQELTFTTAGCNQRFMPATMDVIIGMAGSSPSNAMNPECMAHAIRAIGCGEGTPYHLGGDAIPVTGLHIGSLIPLHSRTSRGGDGSKCHSANGMHPGGKWWDQLREKENEVLFAYLDTE